eukprot:3165654-Amphidinium_carterae.1
MFIANSLLTRISGHTASTSACPATPLAPGALQEHPAFSGHLAPMQGPSASSLLHTHADATTTCTAASLRVHYAVNFIICHTALRCDMHSAKVNYY